jgi:hypothetical protein
MNNEKMEKANKITEMKYSITANNFEELLGSVWGIASDITIKGRKEAGYSYGENIQLKHLNDIMQVEKVKFFNTKTSGDEINALVKHFTGKPTGAFILEEAAKKVKENTLKINALIDELKGVN